MNEVYSEKQYYDEFTQCIMLKEKSILLDLLFHFHKREAIIYDQEVVENVTCEDICLKFTPVLPPTCIYSHHFSEFLSLPSNDMADQRYMDTRH